MTKAHHDDNAVRQRFAIVDPCYHKKGGHHHAVNRELVRQLKWLRPQIYVDSLIQIHEVSADYPSLTLQPFFTDLGYISHQRYSSLADFCELARAFSSQMNPVSADFIVAHTLLHYHLFGLGLYLAAQPPKQVAISLMFSPVEGLRPEPNDAIDFCFTSIALRSLNDAALKRNHRITIGITSELHWILTAKFRESLPFLTFVRSPWLVGAHNFISPKEIISSFTDQHSKPAKHRILLYLGDAKPDKGIEAALQFLKWLAARPKDMLVAAQEKIKIEIHITHCDDWLRSCVDEIRDLCSQLPTLTAFSNKHYSNQDYFNILTSANSIVWLYDPRKYRCRSSGIFYDALSLRYSFQQCQQEPHFVVSKGSWMEQEFQLLGFAKTSIDLTSSNWMHDLWHLLITLSDKPAPQSRQNTDLLSSYYGQSWSRWLLTSLGLTEKKLLEQIRQANTDRRILIVISTDYPHFTRLSGPTGFVKYLEGAFHFETHIGKSQKYDWLRTLTGLKSATDDALRLEQELIHVLKGKPADIICVDGEHAGSLLALGLRDQHLHPQTRIYAWYHQPSSILSSEIIDKSTFPAANIYPICISPCQFRFFEEELAISKNKVSVIPHGVHAELISIGHKGVITRSADNGHDPDCPIRLLTVGNWLRDRSLIFKAAQACPEYEFVWVSTEMTLDQHEQSLANAVKNLTIITSGLSNDELFQLYITSDYLFQPLISATANNAIIEAMAFGLPIITKRLESTIYYTGGHSLFYSDHHDAIRLLKGIPTMLRSQYVARSQALSSQVVGFEWSKVASQFVESLPKST